MILCWMATEFTGNHYFDESACCDHTKDSRCRRSRHDHEIEFLMEHINGLSIMLMGSVRGLKSGRLISAPSPLTMIDSPRLIL